jgi:hypothetical protein
MQSFWFAAPRPSVREFGSSCCCLSICETALCSSRAVVQTSRAASALRVAIPNPWARKRASINAHEKFTTSAPKAPSALSFSFRFSSKAGPRDISTADRCDDREMRHLIQLGSPPATASAASASRKFRPKATIPPSCPAIAKIFLVRTAVSRKSRWTSRAISGVP